MGIKTCHCDSKRVYAEINNDGEKFGKGEMRGNKNPAGHGPCGTRWSNTLEITPINEIIYSPSHFLPLSERSQKLNNNVAAKMHR